MFVPLFGLTTVLKLNIAWKNQISNRLLSCKCLDDYFGNGEDCLHKSLCDEIDIENITDVHVWSFNGDTKVHYNLDGKKFEVTSYDSTKGKGFLEVLRV